MKCSIDALYANNEIYEVKLYLSLSYLDWCKLLKKEEFLHLIKYLNNQGILKSNSEILEDLHLKEKLE